MKKKMTALILAAALGLTLLSGCDGSGGENSGPSDLSSDPASSEPAKVVINPLTGEDGFNPDAVGKRPVAVMVSNIKDSLPQWGISEADLVYEAVTEGGITRLMCMYADPDAVPKVGPVRSVREYYPQFSEPFHALFVHFGGSTTGYDALSEYKIEDIDGMAFSGTAFLQDQGKVSSGISREHTFYTSTELLEPAISKKGFSMSHSCPSAFHFVEPGETAALSDGSADRATVRFSGYTTAVFEYDQSSGKYLKSQYGQAHIDANNQQRVAVDNVVILYAPTSKIGDTYLTRYDLTSGEGYYLSKGKVQELNWSKGTYNAMFKLTDSEGGAVSFNPGKTWVCVVPNDQKGSTVLEDTQAASSPAE